jgi:hypothetical protein
MPLPGRLEFPNSKPRLYTVAWRIVAGAFAANLLVSYLIRRYWSVVIADKAHPDAILFNGTVIHVSAISLWIFKGSFITMFLAILVLVGLGFYYRSTGLANPPARGEETTQLNLNRDR